jgi:hypothetical protein
VGSEGQPRKPWHPVLHAIIPPRCTRQASSIVTIAAIPISPHFLLVQIGTKMIRKPFVGDSESIDSRILRLVDGTEVGAQDDLPRVANAMAGRLITFGTDNDVWVDVRRFFVEPDRSLAHR